MDYASKSGGDVVPFLKYAARGLVDGLRGQLEYIWDQQWDVAWQNFVHEKFQSKNSASEVRQRHLVLDMGDKRDWVAVGDIAELTPRMAKAYAGKTPKTIQRDLNALADAGLILREGRKVKACREIILAFLPLRCNLDKIVPTDGVSTPPAPN